MSYGVSIRDYGVIGGDHQPSIIMVMIENKPKVGT